MARSHTLAAAELLETKSTGTAFTHKFCYRARILTCLFGSFTEAQSSSLRQDADKLAMEHAELKAIVRPKQPVLVTRPRRPGTPDSVLTRYSR